jgi:N-acyl-D-amino-acid deacylase
MQETLVRQGSLILLIVASVFALGGVPTGSSARAEKAKFDLVIKNGRVADGTGTASYVADVAIAGGKIVSIGRIESDAAEKALDAASLVVAPGFIDMMGQTATPILRDPDAALNLLTQGITTINAGEGVSAAPLDADAGASSGWTSMAEYFQLLELKGLPLNVVQTVGHTQVRQIVLGDTDRRPSDEELERMRGMVREAMEAGAIGVSTALIYPPAIYASTQEITALAAVAGEYGGGYYTHMRNEGDLLLEAIDEALQIGRQAKTSVHIFHLKTAGRQNWPKMQLAIANIKKARAEGQQVTADIYPYINNGLSLEAFIHPRHFAGGRAQLLKRLEDEAFQKEVREEIETSSGWENWYRHVGKDWSKVIVGYASGEKYSNFLGRSVAQIAAELKEDPWDTFFALARSGAFALPESMTEANKLLAIEQEFMSFCTDAGPGDGSRIGSHPRAFGAFPRLLSRYVRDLGAISLERAFAQGSAAAANQVFAYDRGRIAEGLAADIIVFDPNEVVDKATFATPHEHSAGIRHVIVNGVQVLADGKFTGKRPGKVLRGPGYRPDTAPFAVSTGPLDPSLEPIDTLVREYIERHHIPGAAIALTDHGRLVLARGYGYADISNKKRVEPASLFRIASISKPITAVAILQLVQSGKLRLDDHVVDVLRYDPHLENGAKFDERYRSITIEHLLQHRGGWDRDKSFDAMFQPVRFAQALKLPPPAQPEQVIRCMMGLPLDFDPGERYAYSNFGYCLLGRVIEVVSGQNYESYVKQHVFAPLGSTSPRLGKTRIDDNSIDDEVKYYCPDLESSVFAKDLGLPVPTPYGGFNLEAMDAHGGWTASAIDLVRFASAFDEPQNCKILNEEAATRMFARPEGPAREVKSLGPNHYYSCGWINRLAGDENSIESWHTGSLAGTATLLVRRHDGRNFAILFNARSDAETAHFASDIREKVIEALDKLQDWPEVDMFDEF